MGRIGILCGAFDPVHLGHLAIARAGLSHLKLSQVLLVPCEREQQRSEISLQQRLEMLRIATAGEVGMDVLDAISLSTPRYAVDVVAAVAAAYPGRPITLMVGADELADLPRWQDADRLLALCQIAVYPREGYDAGALAEGLILRGARVEVLPCPGLDMSSRQIRALVRSLSDAPGMLQPEIAAYIAAQGLYQTDYARMVQKMMTASRFVHSLGVRQVGARLALKHGLPMQKAGVAGILHDCAKCLPMKRLQSLAKKSKLSLPGPTLESNALLHGPVGAYITQEQYHIQDQEILDAIYYHTTGRAGMKGVELVIYVADAIEPSRKLYPGLLQIRDQAEVDLKQAALTALVGGQTFIRAGGGFNSPLSQQAIADLTSRMKFTHQTKEETA